MISGWRIHVTGAAELAKVLKDVSTKRVKAGLRRGMTKGARIMAKAYKQNLPSESGLSKRAADWKVGSNKKGIPFAVIGMNKAVREMVMPRGRWKGALRRARRMWKRERGVGASGAMAGKIRWPSKIAHLIEFGRKRVHPKNKRLLADRLWGMIFGRNVAPVGPKFPLTHALQQTQGQVMAIMKTELAAELVKAGGGDGA